MSTKYLLKLRYSEPDYPLTVDKEIIYAELANRPHVYSKVDMKRIKDGLKLNFKKLEEKN